MIKNEEVERLSRHSRITDNQVKFLELYEDCLDVNAAAKKSGVGVTNIRRALKSDTPFARAFRKLSSDFDADPRFNKIGSLSMLLALKKEASDEGKLDLVLKIIQEINRMMEGNLAATKKVVENVDIKVGAVIDLTQPLDSQKTIDIKHEEI